MSSKNFKNVFFILCCIASLPISISAYPQNNIYRQQNENLEEQGYDHYEQKHEERRLQDQRIQNKLMQEDRLDRQQIDRQLDDKRLERAREDEKIYEKTLENNR